jgi:hypothetical protein
VSLLGSRTEGNVRSAAQALGNMKEAALPAVPELIAVLHSTRAEVDTRETAAEALGEIGTKAAKEAVPALNKTAEDKWPMVRKASLSALGEMGPAAREAVPVLRAALEDPDTFISMAARNALFRVQPNKREEVAAIMDKSRREQKGSLHDDLSLLATTLPSRVTDVYELVIYDKFAFAEVPYADSKTGRGKFRYEGGAITGPAEERDDDCKKKLPLAKLNFAIVPGLVKQAPGLLGHPSAKISYVALSGGVFCKNLGWHVYVEKAGLVVFKLDGKVDKVQKN